MATIKCFEELKVWYKARILCQPIMEIVQQQNFLKEYKLKDQINESPRSAMDNIAEGFGRQGNNEFINFLTIANGSAMEVKSQLCRALDRKYIPNDKFDELSLLIQEISKMLIGLIAYLGRVTSKVKNLKLERNRTLN